VTTVFIVSIAISAARTATSSMPCRNDTPSRRRTGAPEPSNWMTLPAVSAGIGGGVLPITLCFKTEMAMS
jgi:hypothetical protein